ncbi:hypothetical protein CWB41_12070 [Methylovirgula ligni]|nr:hypothetical protein CWB41_12070 [Methylovirgula ligni]
MRGSPYGPKEIEIMTAAHEEALALAGVTDRTSAVAELMARRVMDLFFTGADEPNEIGRRVAEEFSKLDVVKGQSALQSDSSQQSSLLP